jgi:hypothetical protein
MCYIIGYSYDVSMLALKMAHKTSIWSHLHRVKKQYQRIYLRNRLKEKTQIYPDIDSFFFVLVFDLLHRTIAQCYCKQIMKSAELNNNDFWATFGKSKN